MALTGLDALDAIAGGLADDRVYLLHGPVGGGKTTFALQFLYKGLLAGEEVAIVTRRPAQAIFDHGRAFGFDLESFGREGQFAIIEYLPRVVENAIRLRDEDRVFQELVTVLDETQPRRIVFDPVTPLLMTGSASGGAFRARALLQSLSSLRASTLVMLDTPDGEDHVASCKDFAYGILQFSPAEEGRSRILLERFPGVKGRAPVIEFEVSPGLGLTSQLVTPAAGGPAAGSATILLAEPDTAQRDAVKALLGRSFTIVDAQDGADVLAKVAVSRPALVIMDADAEGIDGATLCKRLRQNGLGMPVLLLSNPIRRTRDRVAIMASGADDVIERPFDGRILKLKVQALLRRTLGGAVEVHDTAPQRDATVSTEDAAYFERRLEVEAAICREQGLRASLAVLRLTPGKTTLVPAKELRELALSLIREYDIVLLGRHMVGVLLAETDETGVRAFLRRFAEGWNRTPAPVVHFQVMDGSEASLAAAAQLVNGAWAEDAAA